MARINVYSADDGSYLAGWFDYDKARKFDEYIVWNGSNHISLATGDQFEHEQLLRTAGGLWVLNHWSQWEGRLETYRFVTDDQAREWLISQNRDEAVEQYFGELEEEKGPGRPEIGPVSNIRLPLEAIKWLDQRAKEEQSTRAALIRDAVLRWINETRR